MTPTNQGSFRLFRVAGIDLYLHWSWFLVAAYEISSRKGQYTSLAWNAAEYLALFGIVMLHEFGHALACRQVGGKADQIVLWPLGGVAYVQPPQRPGPTLWSIAAGPLVNVALIPVLLALVYGLRIAGVFEVVPDLLLLLKGIFVINLLILVFNLLPIYPLDGGQILHSLLWFLIGRARALIVATSIGFLGVAALVLLAFWSQSVWIGILAVFILMNCWQGFRYALALIRTARIPRRPGHACPTCQSAPPLGPLWTCGHCRKPFDPFETEAVCPHCAAIYSGTQCLDCGSLHPISEWRTPPPLSLADN